MCMTWQTIKSVINNPFTKNTIKSILFYNSGCTYNKHIAEAFDKYFFKEIAWKLKAELSQAGINRTIITYWRKLKN